MVPANSNGASPTPPYSGYHLSLQIYIYGAITLYGRLSHTVQFLCSSIMWSYNPQPAVTGWVWALARSLATTGAITIVFSSSRYLDVSVPWVCSPCGVSRLHRDGLPHSDTCGSIRICQSPQLFAAYHVLLRLWEPRHSPYALIYFSLIRLVYFNTSPHYLYARFVKSDYSNSTCLFE